MLKKVLLGIILVIVVGLVIFLYLHKEATKWTPLLEREEYQKITIDSIDSINVLRYTEGGSESKLLEDREEIENVFRYLENLQDGEETEMACEDNTTIYMIYSQEEEYTIEIECNILVLGKERYIVK